MTNPIPRKAQTGEPTTNTGHFGSKTNTEAEDGLLTRRNAYAREQDSAARLAQDNAAKVSLANLCTELITEFPHAHTLRIDLDENDSEWMWVELTDDDGDPIETSKMSVDPVTIVNEYDIDEMNRFVGQDHNLRELAAWDPTDQCDQHGGAWGDDSTCSTCTTETGEPKQR